MSVKKVFHPAPKTVAKTSPPPPANPTKAQPAPAPAKTAPVATEVHHALRGKGKHKPPAAIAHGALDSKTLELQMLRNNAKAEALKAATSTAPQQVNAGATTPTDTANQSKAAGEPKKADPGSYLNPNNPAAQHVTDQFASDLAKKIDPNSKDPWKTISQNMSMQEFDTAFQAKFSAAADYKADKGDTWDKVYDGIKPGETDFDRTGKIAGDCEDLSFKAASMAQYAHQKLHMAKGMDPTEAAAKAQDEVKLVGSDQHMAVAFKQADGKHDIYDPTSGKVAAGIDIHGKSGEEMGIKFTANRAGTQLVDKNFDMSSYKPALNQADIDRMSSYASGMLGGGESLTPSRTGWAAIAETFFAPPGAMQAYDAIKSWLSPKEASAAENPGDYADLDTQNATVNNPQKVVDPYGNFAGGYQEQDNPGSGGHDAGGGGGNNVGGSQGSSTGTGGGFNDGNGGVSGL